MRFIADDELERNQFGDWLGFEAGCVDWPMPSRMACDRLAGVHSYTQLWSSNRALASERHLTNSPRQATQLNGD